MGSNCAATEITQQFKLYKGRSHFDWGVTTPESLKNFFEYLLQNGREKTKEAFLNNINIFGTNYPHINDVLGPMGPNYEENMKKVERRLERFLDVVEGKNEDFSLFVYVSPYEYITTPSDVNDMISVSRILRKYRHNSDDNYRIAYVHMGNCLDPIRLCKENVDELSAPLVFGDKYYVYPVCNIIREKYGLEMGEVRGKWV